MKLWRFYFSGILYGMFRAADDSEAEGADSESGNTDAGLAGAADEIRHLEHRPLNPYTSQLEDWEACTDDSFYGTLCKRSLIEFFRQLPEYELAVSGSPAAFTTQSGESYSRRADGSYIQRNVKFPKDLFAEGSSVYAVLMPARDNAAVLVLDGYEDQTVLKEWKNVYGSEPFPVVLDGTYQVPTRDGEFLATDVYIPGGVGEKVPAVLVRTPYGKSEGKEQYYRFVQRGYAVVIQDTRGREDSTGEWLPNYYEVEDGDDTLNWIAAQPWSDGSVGMTGGSYLGYVQWAAAASGNPHLKAMLSSVCAGSAFVDVPRRGGCFNSGMLAWAFAMTEQRMRGDLMVREDWDEILNIRPLKDIPRKALGHEVPFLDKWLDHMDEDGLWKRSSWRDRFCGKPVPALIMSGWFDDNGMGTTQALELVKEYYPEGMYKVILGPWMHSGNANYDLHGVYMGDQALRYDMDLLCFQWLEHFLKGADNHIEETSPVEYFTIGENRWKTAGSWPVPQAETVHFYLDADESLTAGTRPQAAGADSYDYDPDNPSTHIIDMSENELEVPENYTEEEKRPDVLCYTTPVLTKDLTVTGELHAVLYLSSDCPDTDLVLRLTDVDEAGTSIKLADSVISAKYRNGFDKPEYLKPGNIYEVKIRTTKISNTFKAGHRLRITVTSSAKNFIFPNSNTELGFDSPVNRIAHNTLHRGGEYASVIEIPIEM